MHVCIARTTHVCTPQAQVPRQSTSGSKTPDNYNHNRATLSPIVDVKAKGGKQNGKDQRGRGISSLASTSSLVIWRKNGVCVSTLPKSNHPNPHQFHSKPTRPRTIPYDPAPFGKLGKIIWSSIEQCGTGMEHYSMEQPWEMRRWGRAEGVE